MSTIDLDACRIRYQAVWLPRDEAEDEDRNLLLSKENRGKEKKMQKKLEKPRYKNNKQDRTYYLVKITQDIDIRSHRIHTLNSKDPRIVKWEEEGVV